MFRVNVILSALASASAVQDDTRPKTQSTANAAIAIEELLRHKVLFLNEKSKTKIQDF